MALRQSVSTDQAPEAIGPYSQGVRSGGLLFCSGQIPLDPSTGEIVKDDVEGQARRCLENLAAVCEAAGGSLGDAVRCTVYLTDMSDFARVNEVYGSFFEGAGRRRGWRSAWRRCRRARTWRSTRSSRSPGARRLSPGRVAQRESARLTRERSLVRTRPRPLTPGNRQLSRG